jgi:hypothetical protein
MAVYVFDGVNKRITLPAEGVVDVADMYSRWKDWVLTGGGPFEQAFSVVGGDPISETTNLAVNVFIRNDLGWRIAPPEQDIDIVMVGNLYPSTSDFPWRASPVGDFQTSINTDNSVNAIVVYAGTGGGGSGSGDRPISGLLWPNGDSGQQGVQGLQGDPGLPGQQGPPGEGDSFIVSSSEPPPPESEDVTSIWLEIV